MRSRAATIALLFGLLGAGAALANGFAGLGGDAPPARIPVPAKDFSATLHDQAGTVVSVSKATFDGEVFLFGSLGEGQATVPFERIRDVRIEPSDTSGKVVAFVTLRDGNTVSVVVEGETPCYGATAFGNYRIPVEKLRKIEFAEAR